MQVQPRSPDTASRCQSNQAGLCNQGAVSPIELLSMLMSSCQFQSAAVSSGQPLSIRDGSIHYDDAQAVWQSACVYMRWRLQDRQACAQVDRLLHMQAYFSKI